MLCVFFGNDLLKVRDEAFSYIDKSGISTMEAIDSDSYSVGVVRNFVLSNSLFAEKKVFLLDTPSLDKEFYKETLDCLEEMKNSTQLFVVIETTLLAAEKKKWQKHSDVLEEYKVVAGERFNNFAMADALAKRDKRSLWVLFNQAKMSRSSFEEIVGIFWWQLKTMRLVSVSKSKEETGLKDFVYQKASRSLANFSKKELSDKSRELLTLSHNSRLGLVDMDVALERWILSL